MVLGLTFAVLSVACDTPELKLKTGSDVPDAVKAFGDAYCALIEPCCSRAGLGSQCQANVYAAADTFDQSAGAACLQALRQQQASSSFCGWLEHESRADWDVTHALRPTRLDPPACATVFDGAPPPPLLTTTGNAGDACVGTAFTAFGDLGATTWQSYLPDVSFPPADARLCEQDKGLFCDSVTRVCTAGRGLGQACSAPEQCDATRSYCDISTHTCATRVPVGAACRPPCATGASCPAPAPGVDSGLTARTNQCEAPGFCHMSTLTCVVLGELGAVCSPPSRTSTIPPCRSGVCTDGKCASPISLLCGA
jgi:hypothetical protein